MLHHGMFAPVSVIFYSDIKRLRLYLNFQPVKSVLILGSGFQHLSV